jgi:anti-sigma B factor antagonist
VRIDYREDNDFLIISVDGRIDTLSAPEFQTRMEELMEREEKTVILDLEKLQYVSSAGLRAVLVSAKKAAASGKKLSCCCLQEMVRRVFDVSGFTGIIPVFDSLEDAVRTG